MAAKKVKKETAEMQKKLNDAHNRGYSNGFLDGREEGLQQGYEDGFRDGQSKLGVVADALELAGMKPREP